ncbi:hypothetical protein [Pseudooceanicola nanhaiensis]|uniref:hypothetical protein n=1 Tax=Pseudooceanicola nanhaiensis TaxID=375761 RepID=UPI001CD4A79B|nr:hypothetical protein [Pseudooceanicola nanhaiensis]MCA0922795.1 hypothetical protein [Pseudooceanicola nanhaiensis]
MTELVLHIGDMKTGTTSIQSALLAQDWQGATRRVCYPTAPGQPYHHALVEFIRQNNTEQVTRSFDEIRERIETSDAEIAVISSELLEEFPAEQVMEVFARHLPDLVPTMRVLAYVRPHAERVMSSWTQQMKLGFFSEGVEDFLPGFLSRGKLAYSQRFGAWRDIVGPRLTLRPMIRSALAGGDVVQDFMAQVLPGDSLTFPPRQEINETLSIADLALLRRLHQHPKRVLDDRTRDAHMRMGEYLAYTLSALPRSGSPRPALSRAAYERIRETCTEDARLLDETFFDGRPMQDALLAAEAKVTEEAQSLDPADHLGPEELRLSEVYAVLLHDLVSGAPVRINEVLMQRIDAVMRGSGD